MKELILFLFFTVSFCNSKEGFLEQKCKNEVVQNRLFFKKMKNIDHFINYKSGKIISKKINMGYDDLKGKHKNVKFDIDVIDDYFDVNRIILRNDSLIFIQKNGIKTCLFAFNVSFVNKNIALGLTGKFVEKNYDKCFNDSVYKFKYSYYYKDEIFASEHLNEIEASKERGILRISYKDIFGDIWIGGEK